jgi:hypothetical protein
MPYGPHISFCSLLVTALCDMLLSGLVPVSVSICLVTDRWFITVSVQIDVFNNVDSFPSRRFSLEWPTYQIKVGRGSHSGEKELFPASNNAWFESRVMSRQHAILQADPVTKVQPRPRHPWQTMLTQFRMSTWRMSALCTEHTWKNESSCHAHAKASILGITSNSELR